MCEKKTFSILAPKIKYMAPKIKYVLAKIQVVEF